MKRFLIPGILAMFGLLIQLPAQEQLPEAIKKSIAAHFPGAEIEEVEVEKEGKRTRYEIELEIDGDTALEREVEIVFTPAGTMLEIESDVIILPKAVKAALDKQFHHARIREAELVRRFSYEIEFSAKEGGAEHELHFTPEGDMIDDEHEMAVNMQHLPPAVRSMAQASFAHGRISEIELTGAREEAVYEIEGKVGNKEHDVSVTTSGNLVLVEAEIEAKNLPAELRGVLEKLEKDHKIAKIEFIDRYFYEVEINAPGHVLECLVCPSGQVLAAAVERDDDDEDGEKAGHGDHDGKEHGHGDHDHDHDEVEDHDEDEGEDRDPESDRDR